MLAEAKREAERIVKGPRAAGPPRRERGDHPAGRARRRGDRRGGAGAEREIRLGAEDYADDILSTLEVNLQKFLQAVQRGRDRLQGREREPSEIG